MSKHNTDQYLTGIYSTTMKLNTYRLRVEKHTLR